MTRYAVNERGARNLSASYRGLVLEAELVGDDGEIAHGIHIALDVRNVLVGKSAGHVEDGVAGGNVG